IKLLIMKLEIIRNKVEKFSEEIAREYYLQGAGLKNDVDFERIYQRYDGLFSEENSLTVQEEFNKKSSPENEMRRNKMLLEAFFMEIANQKNNKLHSKYLSLQTSGKINISKKEKCSYRGSAILMISEHSHDKR